MQLCRSCVGQQSPLTPIPRQEPPHLVDDCSNSQPRGMVPNRQPRCMCDCHLDCPRAGVGDDQKVRFIPLVQDCHYPRHPQSCGVTASHPPCLVGRSDPFVEEHGLLGRPQEDPLGLSGLGTGPLVWGAQHASSRSLPGLRAPPPMGVLPCFPAVPAGSHSSRRLHPSSPTSWARRGPLKGGS